LTRTVHNIKTVLLVVVYLIADDYMPVMMCMSCRITYSFTSCVIFRHRIRIFEES